MRNLVGVFLRWISPDFGGFFIKWDLAFELGVKEWVIGEFYKERWCVNLALCRSYEWLNYWAVWLNPSEIVCSAPGRVRICASSQGRQTDVQQSLLGTSKWKYASQAKTTEGFPHHFSSIHVSHKTQKILHVWQRSGFWHIFCSIFCSCKYHTFPGLIKNQLLHLSTTCF